MHKDTPTFTYRLDMAYDGTNYSGWQKQPNAPSIQQTIEQCLYQLFHSKYSVIGSGRTDAEVHAKGQVAHFRSSTQLNLRKLFYSLNGLLPDDIRITRVSHVANTFHAQKKAKAKEYHYIVCTKKCVLPFEKNYCFHFPHEFDRSLLEQAAMQFIGTHDFCAFSNQNTEGACAKNSIRTIYRIDIVPTETGFRFEFEGNGFLYKMVRNIVGMCFTVARKKRSISDIQEVLLSRDRRKASTAAPAYGLFLMHVSYDESIHVYETFPSN